MDGLNERIHALPPELFNRINDFVFTAEPGNRIVDGSYKPSQLLSVSKSTRLRFAQSVYGSASTFVFHDVEFLVRWLAALDPIHKAMLQKVQYRSGEQRPSFVRDFGPPIDIYDIRVLMNLQKLREIVALFPWGARVMQ